MICYAIMTIFFTFSWRDPIHVQFSLTVLLTAQWHFSGAPRAFTRLSHFERTHRGISSNVPGTSNRNLRFGKDNRSIVEELNIAGLLRHQLSLAWVFVISCHSHHYTGRSLLYVDVCRKAASLPFNMVSLICVSLSMSLYLYSSPLSDQFSRAPCIGVELWLTYCMTTLFSTETIYITGIVHFCS
jgi:hypothetical protein